MLFTQFLRVAGIVERQSLFRGGRAPVVLEPPVVNSAAEVVEEVISRHVCPGNQCVQDDRQRDLGQAQMFRQHIIGKIMEVFGGQRNSVAAVMSVNPGRRGGGIERGVVSSVRACVLGG